MNVIASWSALFRRTSLRVKLAVLGAAVTGAVVTCAFWGLGVQTRANARDVFRAQLARDQRTLQHLQDRERQNLRFTVALAAEGPAFQYSLKQFQAEVNRGAAPDRGYVIEMQRHLDRLGLRTDADLIVLTDDAGRVFASAGRDAAAAARGTALGSLAAVAHALDPAAPVTAELAVLRTPAGFYQVAAVPLVQDGYTLGTLLLGARLDAGFVAEARAASDANIVLLAGNETIAMSDSSWRPAGLTTALTARETTQPRESLRLGREEYVTAVIGLGQTQDGAPVRLWILQPLSRHVDRLMQPLRREFALFGGLAVLVAALGAAFVANSVLGPFTRFVAYMRSGAVEQRPGGFDAHGEALEVRTLNASFNQLMDALAGQRRALEERSAELTAANIVLTDEINERIRVEAALRESEAQLRQSQKLEAIGTLAGGIAHDFNNLITVISGYTQLATLHIGPTSEAKDDLKQVMDASTRAASLTHQLLAFSRKQVLQPTVLDLNEIVDGIAPMLRRIIGERVQLEVDTATPLARVRADRGQLEQVLLNLAVNARDAMPDGGTVTIATANANGADATLARAVTLLVRDTGIGMAPEVKERVFEPFFTTKDVGKGTGLGLSMVYGIIHQSGGSIALDSTLGAGTTFTITLPAVDDVVDAESTDDREESLTGHECILIVEDADDVRTLARRTLEGLGYTVRVARHAAEALTITAAGAPDLLLTDIVLPQMSGPQLVARYRAQRVAPVVVYMSGYADEALDSYELEADTLVLRKPFTPTGLARVVRQALDAAHAVDRASVAA